MSQHVRLFDPEDEKGIESKPGDAGAVTVRAVIAAYLSDIDVRHKAGQFSRASLLACRRDLARFSDRFGNLRIDGCRNTDLTDFIFGNDAWQSNATRRRVLAEVLACFSWAEGDGGLIKASPYRRPKRLRLHVRPRRAAKPDEYVALMRFGRRAMRRALFFLRRVGCRPGEMREATWPSVDWAEAVIVLDEHKAFAATGSPRVFGLEPCTFRFLRNLYKRCKDRGGHIFLNCRGKPWTADAFSRLIRDTLQRLRIDPGKGKRLTAYCFRHSWTTAAIEAGVTDRGAADQLGHTSTAMIPWYSKAKQKFSHLRKVAEQAVRRERKRKAPKDQNVLR